MQVRLFAAYPFKNSRRITKPVVICSWIIQATVALVFLTLALFDNPSSKHLVTQPYSSCSLSITSIWFLLQWTAIVTFEAVLLLLLGKRFGAYQTRLSHMHHEEFYTFCSFAWLVSDNTNFLSRVTDFHLVYSLCI